MPNITIYVDRDLDAEIRAYKVPISLTCQRALRRQVRLAARAAGVANPIVNRPQQLRDRLDEYNRPAS